MTFDRIRTATRMNAESMSVGAGETDTLGERMATRNAECRSVLFDTIGRLLGGT
ncbi:MAG: hypothetical protein IH897_08800 [Planctomycetes bacterium]|nr:hypothetical protein [Planctomycetota bacterium]